MPRKIEGEVGAEIADALAELVDEKGEIAPATVVGTARGLEGSPLNACFNWDDGIAAADWRLEQARRLLRTVRSARVIYDPVSQADRSVMVPVFATYAPADDGRNFRLVSDVLTLPAHRRALLAEAYAEMLRFKARYGVLSELAEVHSAMLRASKAVGGPQVYASRRKAKREAAEGGEG